MPAKTKSKIFHSFLIAGLGLTASAQGTGHTTVPGNVSTWVGTASHTGTAAGNQTVTIAVHMAMHDTDQLRDLVAEISKPGSPSYGKYLAPAAVQSRFAPSAADAAAVVKLLKSAGMTQVEVGPANAYVSATATVAQLRSTFAVSQEMYRYGTHVLRANREAPTLPAALAGKVLFIEGLDESTTLKQPFHVSATQGEMVAPASVSASSNAAAGSAANSSLSAINAARTAPSTAITPPPVAANNPSPFCSTYFGDTKAVLSTKPAPYDKTMPWLVCGYTPQQIQQAYGLNRVSLDGTGVTVAIIDAYASPTLMADGNRYAANHSLPALTSANFTQIIPQGIYNVSPTEACGPYGWWTEESLDLAAVHGSAPGAKIVYIGARDCGTSLSIALLNAIYNKQADIVTNSYGNNGESVDPGMTAMEEQAFMVAAAQGQTLLFSSGDDGDLSQINGVATGSWESTSAYVTAVGGTSLGLRSATSKGEWGWGTNRDYLANAAVNSAASITTSGLTQTSFEGTNFSDFTFYAGSGGGISLLEAQPDYQVGIVPTALATTLNQASGNAITLPHPMRVTPDVAMDADPYTGYLYGETYTISGVGTNDYGCVATSSTTEYCEIAEGGTSLASPLMAGMFAVMNQARLNANKAEVGFANPLLYGLKIGSTLTSAGINDVLPPANPTAVLRGYASNLKQVRVVTINSVPFDIYPTPFPLLICATTICEGIDDVFNYTTPGYDDVTGLGVPYAPQLIRH